MRFWLRKKGTRLYSPGTMHNGVILIENTILFPAHKVKRDFPQEEIKGIYWEEAGKPLQVKLDHVTRFNRLNVFVFALAIIMVTFAFLQLYRRMDASFSPSPTPTIVIASPTPKVYRYLIGTFRNGKEEEYLCADYRVGEKNTETNTTEIYGWGCMHQTEVYTITNVEWFTVQSQKR